MIDKFTKWLINASVFEITVAGVLVGFLLGNICIISEISAAIQNRPIEYIKKNDSIHKSGFDVDIFDRGVSVRVETIPVYVIEEIPEITCQCTHDQNDSFIDWDKIHDVELLAQLIQAEAGNQDLHGMRLVADVVLNRVDDDRWPDTIEEVIYQKGQFSVVANGMFKKAANEISEEAYLAAEMEWNERLDDGIVFFNSGKSCLHGELGWKYGDHWFAY